MDPKSCTLDSAWILSANELSKSDLKIFELLWGTFHSTKTTACSSCIENSTPCGCGDDLYEAAIYCVIYAKGFMRVGGLRARSKRFEFEIEAFMADISFAALAFKQLWKI
jgi:hypothetical protein